jgi:hypothetical protein
MTMSQTDNLISQWEELRVLVESLNLDIVKNANGNRSAGVRARRGLRDVKKQAAALVKVSLESDKAR